MKPYEKKWHPNGWYYDEKKEKWVGPDYQAEHGAKSPTGWTYDRDTLLWNPPDSLSAEAEKKWRWDPEKQIWIDIEKERRIERHNQWRKEQGKGPTFEEWKKQRLAEKALEEEKQKELQEQEAAAKETQTE